MKQADEVLTRPYRRVLIPDTESGGYTALIEEFQGCIAEGDTADEALRNLEEAAASWIEAAEHLGQQIPQPQEEESYSGRLALRLPKSLHRRAAHAARAEKTSLNQFLVSAISERLGYLRGRQDDASTTKADVWGTVTFDRSKHFANFITGFGELSQIRERLEVSFESCLESRTEDLFRTRLSNYEQLLMIAPPQLEEKEAHAEAPAA